MPAPMLVGVVTAHFDRGLRNTTDTAATDTGGSGSDVLLPLLRD